MVTMWDMSPHPIQKMGTEFSASTLQRNIPSDSLQENLRCSELHSNYLGGGFDIFKNSFYQELFLRIPWPGFQMKDFELRLQ